MSTIEEEVSKIIHQSYISEETVPEHWQESMAACRKFCEENEGWEYRFWSDEDNRKLIEEQYPWFLEQYDGYSRGINRADAVRPFYLHAYGGIYMDLDIVPKSTMIDLYNMYKSHPVSISLNRPGNGVGTQCYTNAFMMSQKGAEYWTHVWDVLKDPTSVSWWKKLVIGIPYYNVLFSTGPGVVSDAAQLMPVVPIPGELTQPGYPGNPLPYETPESVVRIIEGSSWHEADAKFWNGIKGGLGYTQHLAWFLVILLIVVILFSGSRVRRCATCPQ